MPSCWDSDASAVAAHASESQQDGIADHFFHHILYNDGTLEQFKYGCHHVACGLLGFPERNICSWYVK